VLANAHRPNPFKITECSLPKPHLVVMDNSIHKTQKDWNAEELLATHKYGPQPSLYFTVATCSVNLLMMDTVNFPLGANRWVRPLGSTIRFQATPRTYTNFQMPAPPTNAHRIQHQKACIQEYFNPCYPTPTLCLMSIGSSNHLSGMLQPPQRAAKISNHIHPLYCQWNQTISVCQSSLPWLAFMPAFHTVQMSLKLNPKTMI